MQCADVRPTSITPIFISETPEVLAPSVVLSESTGRRNDGNTFTRRTSSEFEAEMIATDGGAAASTVITQVCGAHAAEARQKDTSSE